MAEQRVAGIGGLDADEIGPMDGPADNPGEPGAAERAESFGVGKVLMRLDDEHSLGAKGKREIVTRSEPEVDTGAGGGSGEEELLVEDAGGAKSRGWADDGFDVGVTDFEGLVPDRGKKAELPGGKVAREFVEKILQIGAHSAE